MTNKLVVIINSLRVSKIKKLLLYEMKFLVPNYSCLQNPWLGGYCPQIPFLSVLNRICWTPSDQNSWVRHWSPWEANRFSASQEITRILWNSKVMHTSCVIPSIFISHIGVRYFMSCWILQTTNAIITVLKNDVSALNLVKDRDNKNKGRHSNIKFKLLYEAARYFEA